MRWNEPKLKLQIPKYFEEVPTHPMLEGRGVWGGEGLIPVGRADRAVPNQIFI